MASIPANNQLGLRRLVADRLEIGKPLPGAICNTQGRPLLRRGHLLKQEDIDLLRTHIRRGIYGGGEWPARYVDGPAPHTAPDVSATPTAPPADPPVSIPPSAASPAEQSSAPGTLVPISLESLYVGKTLSHPIFSRNGVLLLAAGIEITHRFLGRLRQQGVCEVHIRAREQTVADRHQPTAGRIRIERQLDSFVEHLRRTELAIGKNRVPRRDLPLEFLREETERGREQYTESVSRAAEIADDVFRGKCTTAAGASDMLTPFMEMLTSDSSLLPAIAKMKQTPGEYLYQHSLNVSLLSMAAAARLGVRKEILLEIGMGAFLQDVGMLEMPDEIRLAARPLTPEERMLVAEHPHYTLDYLQGIEGLGSISLVICYQAHERANGAGYPHNRPRREIHPYARLVSAADVYTAVSSYRPYRPARPPYEAIVTVLRDTSNNLFDRDVIRNLLDCISLFPIGSNVRLSNGQYAKVLRANPDHHTKPVIVPLNDDLSECDYEIDLARTNYATIVAAMPHVLAHPDTGNPAG